MSEETEERSGMSFKEILALIKNNWIWFAASIVFFLCVGIIYIYRQQPKYTRSAQILIKDDKTGSGVVDMADMIGIDGLTQNSNLYNELAIIQSPDLMEVVVKDLDLNKSYATDARLGKKALYGLTLPIKIDVDSAHAAQGFRLECEITGPDTFVLHDFKTKKQKFSDEVTGRFGETVETPVGLLTIVKTDALTEDLIPMTVYFGYSDTYTSAVRHQGLLKSNVKDQKSSIIELAYTDESVERADDILRTVISAYNQNWLDDRNQVAINTSKFINARLREIEGQLENVDTDISSFKSSNLLPDVTETSSRFLDQATKANDAILALNNQLYMARYVGEYLDNIKPDQTLPINSGFESQGLSQQISAYNQKVIERNNLVAVSSLQNPAVEDYDRALGNMRQSIKASVNSEIAALKEQIASQQKYQDQAVSKIASNPTQAKYLLSVERQQKVIESLYLYLLQKREENEFTQSFKAANARIIKAPNGVMTPTAPRKKLILLAMFVIGAAVPFAYFYLRQRLTTTVRSRKDLDGLNIPLLGEIPLAEGAKKRLPARIIDSINKRKNIDPPTRIVVEKGSRDVINETFRILRTNLNMVMGNETSKNVVAITSFNIGSGKSFVSMNLAIAYALKDKRVLVVDCDLRHGSSSKYVDSPRRGLVDYLTGVTDDISAYAVTMPGHPTMKVMPIGSVPPNPTELLENGRLSKYIESVRADYDLIILDCPPIDIVADTQIIEQNADRTLFIVRIGLFEKDQVPEIERLYKSHIYKNMALILNGVDNPLRHHSRHNSYYYYTTK